jgi:hypothetical protein
MSAGRKRFGAGPVVPARPGTSRLAIATAEIDRQLTRESSTYANSRGRIARCRRISRSWVRRRLLLCRGAWLAAWEQPQLLSEEVRAGFRSLRKSSWQFRRALRAPTTNTECPLRSKSSRQTPNHSHRCRTRLREWKNDDERWSTNARLGSR